jgi:drug/metabolite transporter (DMT)-like permease
LSSLSVRERRIGVASAIALLLIWTTFILVTRFSARRTLLPFDIVFLRFLCSGLLILPFALRRRAQLRAGLGGTEALKRGATLAMIAGVIYCSFAYAGFYFAPAAHAAVLLAGSLPLATAALAVLLLGERLTTWGIGGLALIFIGDLLVGGHSMLQAFRGGSIWIGDVLFMCATLCWGLYAVLCRRWRVGAIDATMAIALGCLVSFVPLYALLVATGIVPSGLGAASWPEIVLLAIYQGGIVMVIAGLAFTHVVATFGPVFTTMLTAMVPPLAALLAVPLLKEPLGATALGGLACVTFGLLIGLGPRLLARRPAASRT